MTHVATAMTTRDLLARLRRHYIKPGELLPGGVFVDECGWNPGGGSRADALYLGFTSTSGRILIGHELKVTRADWQHELDQNGKADQWADQCHQWFIVAPSTDVVPPDTVPHGWGLMIPSPRSTTRMAIALPADVHRERQPSFATMRSLISRYDTLRAQAIVEAREKARNETFQAVREAQAEARQSGLLRTDPEVAKVAEILTAVKARLGRWQDPEPALVVDAIVDAHMVGQVTHNARRQLAELVVTTKRMTEPLAGVAKNLAALEAPDFEPSAGLY